MSEPTDTGQPPLDDSGLFDEVRKLAQRFARGSPMRLPVDETSDIAQSVARELFEQLGEIEYRSGPEFRALIAKITARKIVGKTRHATRARRDVGREVRGADPADHLKSPTPGPVTELVHAEDLANLQAAIRGGLSMAPAEIDALRLLADGKSPREIAEALQTTTDAVHTRLYGARQRLREWIAHRQDRSASP